VCDFTATLGNGEPIDPPSQPLYPPLPLRQPGENKEKISSPALSALKPQIDMRVLKAGH